MHSAHRGAACQSCNGADLYLKAVWSNQTALSLFGWTSSGCSMFVGSLQPPQPPHKVWATSACSAAVFCAVVFCSVEAIDHARRSVKGQEKQALKLAFELLMSLGFMNWSCTCDTSVSWQTQVQGNSEWCRACRFFVPSQLHAYEGQQLKSPIISRVRALHITSLPCACGQTAGWGCQPC